MSYTNSKLSTIHLYGKYRLQYNFWELLHHISKYFDHHPKHKMAAKESYFHETMTILEDEEEREEEIQIVKQIAKDTSQKRWTESKGKCRQERANRIRQF